MLESFKKQPDAVAARDYLAKFAWPKGMIEAFVLNVTKIPIRFFIVDDSGSMNTSDGFKVIGSRDDSKIISCTRWSELSSTVKFHAGLSEAVGAPTEFRLLNGADPIMVGLKVCTLNSYTITTLIICCYIIFVKKNIKNILY